MPCLLFPHHWFKNLHIRLFAVAWHWVAWVTLGDNRKAPISTRKQLIIR